MGDFSPHVTRQVQYLFLTVLRQGAYPSSDNPTNMTRPSLDLDHLPAYLITRIHFFVAILVCHATSPPGFFIHRLFVAILLVISFSMLTCRSCKKFCFRECICFKNVIVIGHWQLPSPFCLRCGWTRVIFAVKNYGYLLLKNVNLKGR